MKRKLQSSIIEVSLTVDKGQMNLIFHAPYKWFGIVIISLILWRVPELWKAIETVYSLFGK